MLIGDSGKKQQPLTHLDFERNLATHFAVFAASAKFGGGPTRLSHFHHLYHIT